MKPWERVAKKLRIKQPDIKKERSKHRVWRLNVQSAWQIINAAFPRLNKDKFFTAAGYWG